VISVIVRLLLRFQWKNQIFSCGVCCYVFLLISSDLGTLFECSREVAGSGLSLLVILSPDSSTYGVVCVFCADLFLRTWSLVLAAVCLGFCHRPEFVHLLISELFWL
jgi:hypothetical protein